MTSDGRFEEQIGSRMPVERRGGFDGYYDSTEHGHDYHPQETIMSLRPTRGRVLRRWVLRHPSLRGRRSGKGLSRPSNPQLIILDVVLPGIDGLEVCRRIKSDAGTKHLMVLQVSAARGTAMDRAAGLDCGADAYLVEPIDHIELLATVRALLHPRAVATGQP